MHCALTIAGSDSGGGAGIQTDLKTFSAHEVYGTSVITALTAQNTRGVHGIHTVPAAFVAAQMEAVLTDIPVSAAKTGMLGEADVIAAVAETAARYQLHKLVVDPVMVAESGDRLLREDAVDTLREKLLPLALIITPNLPEASVLLGRYIKTEEEMIAAARDLYRFGPRYVLVKGGHLPGNEMTDILYDGTEIYRFSAEKIQNNHTHGSGCSYAAAITANLARGLSPLEAVKKAKDFITAAIAHGAAVGSGYGPTNPMGSLWQEIWQLRAKQAFSEAVRILQQNNGALQGLGDRFLLLFCRDGASSIEDIASLKVSFAKTASLDEPAWGSPLLAAPLLLEAHRSNSHIRAALSLPYPEHLELPAVNTAAVSGKELFFCRLEGKDVPQLLIFADTLQVAARKAVTL